MSTAYAAPPRDPAIDLLEELKRQQSEAWGEFQEARQIKASQPQQVLKQYAQAAKGQRGPFQTFGHFLRSVRECPGGNWHHHQQMSAHMKALPTGMNETSGADGGFLVPPEYSQNLLMRVYANDLLSRTTMFPLNQGFQFKIPAINETSRADGSRFGGVQAYWRAEAGTVTRTKPSIKQIGLEADSLQLVIQVTEELMADASGMTLEQFINLVAPQELAFKIGDGIVNGNGVNTMMGLMQSPSKIAQAAETGQQASTIVAANILKMWSRLHVSCHPNAVWLIDQSIIPQLGTMTIGTAGANMVVYQPPGMLSAAPYATLMGRPVITTEFGQQLGTEGDIILTDLSTYLTVTRGGMQTASSMHVLFETNEMLYRFTMRLGGSSWWLSALTPKSGGPTQSNIITLSTRS